MNRLGFPFGSAINKNILSNSAYHNWFTLRFTVTTFEDEMKWYTNEYAPGKENYYEADEMLRYKKKHGIFVRGHNFGMILVTNLIGFHHFHRASLTLRSKGG
jgi:GH35 family endo-1,4-beta-xylanase